jgi:predicted alpha/beta hydrolase family esterase
VVARIVLVHGAFNELWGPNELKARWVPALQDGLWHCQVEIDSDDVGVCFYGDLFRHEPGSELERRLARSRPGIADSLANLTGTDAMKELNRAAGDAAFERTVDMVTMMATEPELRFTMGRRLESAIEGRTRVLVAHSLGTVLSYVALCNHPEWSVDTFITLGSPLASPLMVEQVGASLHDDYGAWPGVRRWVNIRAVDDAACAAPLTGVFGTRIEEFLIDNGHRAHAPEPYLNAQPTGEAIAQALA